MDNSSQLQGYTINQDISYLSAWHKKTLLIHKPLSAALRSEGCNTSNRSILLIFGRVVKLNHPSVSRVTSRRYKGSLSLRLVSSPVCLITYPWKIKTQLPNASKAGVNIPCIAVYHLNIQLCVVTYSIIHCYIHTILIFNKFLAFEVRAGYHQFC